ncbi:MAG: hypothetical protein LBD31_03580 [Treponema sp.]|jgi:hypothetical protein|nr:hypothetical protein [Treponema sp.]
MNNKRFGNAAFRMLSLAALILLCASGFAQNKGGGQYDGEYMTVTHNPEGRVLYLIRITGSMWKRYVRYEGDKDWSPYGSGTITVKDNVLTMIDPNIDPDEDLLDNTHVYEWKRAGPTFYPTITLTDETGRTYIKQ